MHYLRGLANIRQPMPETVVTIGNFDGVHLGHQKVISLLKHASDRFLKSVVVSFDPYPKEFFIGDRVPRLMTWREKFLALKKFNIDYFLTIRFNQEFSEVSAEEFIKTILVNTLNAKHIIVGDDFRFGHKRQGNFDLLCQLGRVYGYTVERMPTFEYLNERISSSRIRHTLQASNMELAKNLLGHYYSLIGTVVHGDKIGRTLNFPTANIDLHRRRVPLQGIYIVAITGIDGHTYFGAANVGTRPAVQGTRVLLEVFIFDFNQEIYGKSIEVHFLHKLRSEENYDTLELLKQQIAQDVKDAKTWIANNEHIISISSNV